MKIVVLNDLHPSTNPGAASIAFSLALESSREFETEYWCSSIDPIHNLNLESLSVKCKLVPRRRATRMEGRLLQRLYFELLGFHELFWLYKELRKSNPTHLWVHQIGIRFPKSIILLARLQGIIVFQTFHDFGFIKNRKLYLEDLRKDTSGSLQFGQKGNGFSKKIKNRLELSLLAIRRFLLRSIYKRTNARICISELQSSIFEKFGLHGTYILNNGVSSCACANTSSRTDENLEILFAGRPNAKGLELLLSGIQSYSPSHLHLAGDKRLEEIANKYLSPDRFTYHGFLSTPQIYELIHKVDLVSVLSQCFDVYPTITLEALAHHVPVMTTLMTGNYELVSNLSKNLIIGLGEVPDLNIVHELLSERELKFPDILTVAEVWNNYKKLFIQIC